MLKENPQKIRFIKLHSIINKSDLQKNFKLDEIKYIKIYKFVDMLIEWNKKFNLVGQSTLINPLNSHILDCIQISNHIPNKKLSIADIGTGAGLPGIVLAINDFTNVTLVDSNTKKIGFVKHVVNELKLAAHPINSRIEALENKQYDVIVSRALANLSKLLFYSSLLSHSKTMLFFLKGDKITDEINAAKNKWSFDYRITQSLSDSRGKIIAINNFFKVK